jgi:hypothetical protein
MLPARIDHAYEREKLLADSVRGVAADLRLIDLSDIVTHLKSQQFASTGALVQSSVELWFKRDTLRFSFSGDVRLNWDTLPQVFIDMEFHNLSVHVYFRLMLEANNAGVEIRYISFSHASANPEVNTLQLAEALLDARVNRNVEVGTSEF